MILYSHARRETWRRGSWKKGQFISLRNSKWWEDARSYSHFWKSRCFAQANLHSIQRVFPILPYTFTAHKTFYFYAKYFFPTQMSYHLHFQKKIPFEEGTLDKWTSYKSLRWIPRSAKYQLRGIRQLCQEHRTNWLSSPKRHRICN